MKLDLDRNDLISLAKGTTPNYNVMDRPEIKPHGSYTGGFHDKWDWHYNSFESYSELEIYETYLILKNSWIETDEERKSRLKRSLSDVQMDDPLVMIEQIMNIEFPDVNYGCVQGLYSTTIKTGYQDREEIKQALLSKIPSVWGIEVEPL